MSDVCVACGWYDSYNHAERCRPVLGAAATHLQREEGGDSTKLGYGDERVSFQISSDFVVGLDVNPAPTTRSASYSWRYLHCLHRLSHDQAIDLVHTLRAWEIRRASGPSVRTTFADVFKSGHWFRRRGWLSVALRVSNGWFWQCALNHLDTKGRRLPSNPTRLPQNYLLAARDILAEDWEILPELSEILPETPKEQRSR